MGMGQKRSTREATIILSFPLNVKYVHPINGCRENKTTHSLNYSRNVVEDFLSISGFASKDLQQMEDLKYISILKCP